MSATERLRNLAPNSLRIYSEKRLVRLDSKENPEIEQTYLCIEGTSDAYRWLSAQLEQMANSVDRHESGHAVIVSPRDLPQVKLKEWSSLELNCRSPLESRT